MHAKFHFYLILTSIFPLQNTILSQVDNPLKVKFIFVTKGEELYHNSSY